MSLRPLCLIPAVLVSACFAADLTGNWVVSTPNNDGTSRNLYFDLKQEGSRITGHIRMTQFYYTVKESTGGVDGFTITGSMMDGDSNKRSERKVVYEGKLQGDELHLATHARPGAPLMELVAHRAPAGEGAYPSRLPLPALHKVPYNGLAKTPPMGWNSWNKFHGRVDDPSVREIADAMASNGMKDAGYLYVNIDDTWEGARDAQGNIQSNTKFPNMKALSDYVHSKGLKLGIYSSPGPNTCAGYEGSFGHEQQDAKTYAAWGIDYLKYDWCGARNVYNPRKTNRLSIRKWAMRCMLPAGPSCSASANMAGRMCGSGGRTWGATCGGPRATSAMPGIRWPISASNRTRWRRMPRRAIGTIPTCSRSAMEA